MIVHGWLHICQLKWLTWCGRKERKTEKQLNYYGLEQCFFIGFWFGFIAAMKLTVQNYYDYICDVKDDYDGDNDDDHNNDDCAVMLA